MIKARIAYAVEMSISGHNTNSTYERYGIIDEDAQRQALKSAQLRQNRKRKHGRRCRSKRRG
ncbi:MAG TPA: hypothetical protein VHV54_28030 [Candidatus Binatia bacterium]|nr:hypothetical protein [Candidatus Binatia bacterium]